MEEDEDRVGDVDQRLEDVGERRASAVCISPCQTAGSTGPTRRVKLLGDRVEAAVAERIAAQQPPGGEEHRRGRPRSGRTASLGIGGASRLVAAAARHRGGDPAPIGADRRQEQSRFTWNAPRELASTSSMRAATPASPSLSIRSPTPGARPGRSRGPAGSSVRPRPESLAQDPLDPVALNRAADLAARRYAEARPSSPRSSSARGKL